MHLQGQWLFITIKMRLFKIIRLIATFYKSFLFASLVVTAICLRLFWKYGFGIFTAIFWLKIVTLVLTYYFINSHKSKEYYYYLNLGVSKLLLWATILTFDFAFFLFLIIQTYKLK